MQDWVLGIANDEEPPRRFFRGRSAYGALFQLPRVGLLDSRSGPSRQGETVHAKKGLGRAKLQDCGVASTPHFWRFWLALMRLSSICAIKGAPLTHASSAILTHRNTSPDSTCRKRAVMSNDIRRLED